jgi:hypothetical protein
MKNGLKLRTFKAYFTYGVKAKVELKSNNLIGAINEISPKGFTVGIKAEKQNDFFNLSLYGSAK